MKNFKRNVLIVSISILCLAAITQAAGIWNRGDQTIYGPWDIYKTFTFKSGGGITVDSGATVDVNGTLDLQGATVTMTGKTRSFPLQLTSAMYSTSNTVIGIDGTTAPGLALTDNVPAIVYASSAEQLKLHWGFKIPDDYSTGLGLKVLVSSSASDATNQALDWQLWVNDSGSVFSTAAVAQAQVNATGTVINTTNQELTLTADATALAAVSSGSWLMLDLWNAGSSAGTMEIKGVDVFYTPAH